MPSTNDAKKQLDVIIKKARVHLYKPIQIAEILHFHRNAPTHFQLQDLESYRNRSKRWRDEVTYKLVGRNCTSSAKFQDNIFDSNAMPPALIALLGEENEKKDRAGIVEAYIYKSLGQRLGSLKTLADYVRKAKPETFSLSHFLNQFQKDPGLKRSVDKAYEITVYALFATLVRYLNAEITISIANSDSDLIKDFEDFTQIVLGVTSKNTKIIFPAKLYRVGVTNAADRGLDMWANFGPAIQVKHISLTDDGAEEIVDQLSADKILIVCKDTEKKVIDSVVKQIGYGARVKGIITQSDLERWYAKCFSSKHRTKLGDSLLRDLYCEFIAEFPAIGDVLDEFIKEREYDKIEMKGIFSGKLSGSIELS